MVKNNIRKSLLEQGLALSSSFIESSNKIIQEKFIHYLESKEIANILLYWPYKQEVALDLILKSIDKKSIEIFLPKVFPNKELRFNSYVSDSKLIKNQYNIMESNSEKFISIDKLDLLLIPFVGVDINGCRLGYGGGYYDRALERILNSGYKIEIVGMGYEYQILEDAFGEIHDIKYSIVFSENNIHKYS